MASPIRLNDLDDRLQSAVDSFWAVRGNQGKANKQRDQGNRSSVTGGKQLDALVLLTKELLLEHGVPDEGIHHGRNIDLPGFFRPEKRWDLVVVVDGTLIACAEFKSQVGPSFGNNYNNRTEEAIGNAADIQTAFREGAYHPSPKPWVGYTMLLEDTPRSTSPVRVNESHFPVFPEFKDASYAKRYETGMLRLLREGLYDGASLLLSSPTNSTYQEPHIELSVKRYITSLLGHTIGALAGR